MIGRTNPRLERNERTWLDADEIDPVQSADVFPAGRRLESLLVQETVPEVLGVAALWRATDTRVDEAFERIWSLERRLLRLETDTREVPVRELAYVVFVAAPSGYRLVAAFGRLPTAGDEIGVENGHPAEVLRVGASPLPADRRPCVFAVSTAIPSADVAEAAAALDRRAA